MTLTRSEFFNLAEQFVGLPAWYWPHSRGQNVKREVEMIKPVPLIGGVWYVYDEATERTLLVHTDALDPRI